jgi:hypothetical protein
LFDGDANEGEAPARLLSDTEADTAHLISFTKRRW